jgi:hypothetical protein
MCRVFFSFKKTQQEKNNHKDLEEMGEKNITVYNLTLLLVLFLNRYGFTYMHRILDSHETYIIYP